MYRLCDTSLPYMSGSLRTAIVEWDILLVVSQTHHYIQMTSVLESMRVMCACEAV